VRGDFLDAARLASLYEAKDYEGALRVAEQVLDEYAGNGLAHFNIACMQSLLGRIDEALDHLRAALEANPELLENARSDEDFAALRDDPRFQEFVPSERKEQEA
jgi:tetratricopeptide (TPR) repeat protein